MGTFIKSVAGLCLFVIWALVALALLGSANVPADTPYAGLVPIILILIAIVLSLPVAMVYALGSIASDMREAVRHLRVMRRYYEPDTAMNRRHPPP
jgi:hypothetical protein